ncbi:unnamed protein product, partial [Rotaria sordida]
MDVNKAAEVASRTVCEAIVGSRNYECRHIVEDLLQTEEFRIVITSDMKVIEVLGTLKNIIAGLSNELGYGDNKKAAVICLRLKEIVEFCEELFTGSLFIVLKYRKLFKQFDNGNGHLSLAELDRAIVHFYPQLGTNKKAIMRAYKAADTSGNGFVELREFEKIVQLLNHYDKLSQIFKELDTNDDHRISFSEFKRGFALIGEDDSNENYLRQEFNKIDTNKGGYILFDE